MFIKSLSAYFAIDVSTVKLSELQGLGLKSEKQLLEIGIRTAEELKAIGAVRAFIKLKQASSITPSLNFLYAMVGALENKHWADIKKSEKAKLLIEIEGYQELEKMLREEGVEIEI